MQAGGAEGSPQPRLLCRRVSPLRCLRHLSIVAGSLAVSRHLGALPSLALLELQCSPQVGPGTSCLPSHGSRGGKPASCPALRGAPALALRPLLPSNVPSGLPLDRQAGARGPCSAGGSSPPRQAPCLNSSTAWHILQEGWDHDLHFGRLEMESEEGPCLPPSLERLCLRRLEARALPPGLAACTALRELQLDHGGQAAMCGVVGGGLNSDGGRAVARWWLGADGRWWLVWRPKGSAYGWGPDSARRDVREQWALRWMLCWMALSAVNCAEVP